MVRLGQAHLDGAFFGTTMAHLMFSTMPELIGNLAAVAPYALPKTDTLVPGGPSSSSAEMTAASGAGPVPDARIASTSDVRLQVSRDAAKAVAANRRKRHRRRYAATSVGCRVVGTITHLRNPHPKHGWLSSVYAGPWPGAFRAKYDGDKSTSSSSLSSWEGSDATDEDRDGATRAPPAKRQSVEQSQVNSH